MAHRATVANGYRWRLVIIGLVGVGYAGWAVYDATINYPGKQDRREAYEQFVSARSNDPNVLSQWAEHAREKGWDTDEPEKMSERDILTQWVLFGIAFPVGMYHLVQWGLWSRRFIEGDDDGVRAHGGQSFTWDQVTAVDAQKWDRKGIAHIQYDSGSGKNELTLDDWKYERAPADAIFELLQANVDADKIDGLTTKPAAAETEGDGDADADAEGAERTDEPGPA